MLIRIDLLPDATAQQLQAALLSGGPMPEPELLDPGVKATKPKAAAKPAAAQPTGAGPAAAQPATATAAAAQPAAAQQARQGREVSVEEMLNILDSREAQQQQAENGAQPPQQPQQQQAAQPEQQQQQPAQADQAADRPLLPEEQRAEDTRAAAGRPRLRERQALAALRAQAEAAAADGGGWPDDGAAIAVLGELRGLAPPPQGRYAAAARQLATWAGEQLVVQYRNKQAVLKHWYRAQSVEKIGSGTTDVAAAAVIMVRNRALLVSRLDALWAGFLEVSMEWSVLVWLKLGQPVLQAAVGRNSAGEGLWECSCGDACCCVCTESCACCSWGCGGDGRQLSTREAPIYASLT